MLRLIRPYSAENATQATALDTTRERAIRGSLSNTVQRWHQIFLCRSLSGVLCGSFFRTFSERPRKTTKNTKVTRTPLEIRKFTRPIQLGTTSERIPTKLPSRNVGPPAVLWPFAKVPSSGPRSSRAPGRLDPGLNSAIREFRPAVLPEIDELAETVVDEGIRAPPGPP